MQRIRIHISSLLRSSSISAVQTGLAIHSFWIPKGYLRHSCAITHAQPSRLPPLSSHSHLLPLASLRRLPAQPTPANGRRSSSEGGRSSTGRRSFGRSLTNDRYTTEPGSTGRSRSRSPRAKPQCGASRGCNQQALLEDQENESTFQEAVVLSEVSSNSWFYILSYSHSL